VPAAPDLSAGTRGRPIMVLTQYRVPAGQRREFAAALRELRAVRLRNGAHYWAAFRDLADPSLWNEGYFVDNWLQHLRLLQRMTAADLEVAARAAACHEGPEPPRTRRVVVHGEPDFEEEP